MKRRAVTVILAVLAAILGGAAGSSVASAAGWRRAAHLPDDAAAQAIAGPGSVLHGRMDRYFDYQIPVVTTTDRILVPLFGGDDYSAGNVELFAPDGTDAGLAKMHDRLAAQGWRTHAVRQSDLVEGTEFWAAKDGLTVDAYTTSEDGTSPVLDVTVTRTPPAILAWAAPLGWVLGAVVGVFLLLGLLRLGRRRSTAVALTAGLGLLALLPAGLAALAVTVFYLVGSTDYPVDAPWSGFMLTILRMPADLGAVLLLAALITALIPPRAALPLAGSRPGAVPPAGQPRTSIS